MIAIQIEARPWGLSLSATLDGQEAGRARAIRIADGSPLGIAGPVWRFSAGVWLQRQGVGVELFAAAAEAADGPIVRGTELRAAGLAAAGTTAGGDRLWGSRRLASRLRIENGRAYGRNR